MNNVLNKLIELNPKIQGSAKLTFFTLDRDEEYKTTFNPEKRSADFELVLRALFDECANRDYVITISGNCMIIDHLCGDEIYEGDTSRQSFLQAFCKVTGCE